MQQQAGRRARPPPLMLHWRTLPLPPSVVTWIQSSQGKDLNWWSLVKQQRCDAMALGFGVATGGMAMAMVGSKPRIQ